MPTHEVALKAVTMAVATDAMICTITHYDYIILTYASIIHTFFVSLQQKYEIMAKNLLNKYVWLVETIYKAKKISFEEINQLWLDNDMSEGKPLALRTFHKWRVAIEEMFVVVLIMIK